ncbi:hypothetical protein GCM10009624_21900 [Gordonia sinesedis]
MNERDTTVTPDEARRRLALGETSIANATDRRLQAGGTAAFGFGLGTMAVIGHLLSGRAGAVLSGVAAAALLGVLLWVDARTRAVPRRARLISRVGVGASLLVGLAAVLPWLNLRAQDESTGWGVAALAVLVIALPALVAAALIGRARA